MADTQVKAKGRIARPTALLIDKSGSMSLAIELGKRIGALISAVCDKELYVYAFDTMAYPIERGRRRPGVVGEGADGHHGRRRTLRVGVAVEVMRRKRQYVEQIIVVTDEGENTAPLFVETLQKYREELKADPAVCFVKARGRRRNLEDQCRKAGIMADAFQFTGDYYCAAEPGAAAAPGRRSWNC